MATGTLTSKGQITIPKEIRDQLGVAAGDRIEFSLEADGTVSMRPARHSARELYGYLARPGRRAPGVVEADLEVAEALAKDQERIRRSRG